MKKILVLLLVLSSGALYGVCSCQRPKPQPQPQPQTQVADPAPEQQNAQAATPVKKETPAPITKCKK